MVSGPDRTRWKLFSEAFRAWTPIIVSLCAISLTIFQAAQTRRHTRLSVQPRLDWRIDIDEAGSLTYSLGNSGFGPAVLKELTLLVDGRPIGPDGLATCLEIARLLGRDDPTLWHTSCFDMEQDFVIRAGDQTTIFASRLAPGATAPGAERAARAAEYLRVTGTGRYCSFYEDCWTLE